MTRKGQAFWPVFFGLVLTDCATKRLAETRLAPVDVPHDVAGEVVRFTLAYNPDAAFSMSLGGFSRAGFIVLALGAVIMLARLYLRTNEGDRNMALALAMITGGAVGNLIDRVRSARGVVDFIDVGIGGWRFWTFNVADVGVTVGAVLLGVLLWRASEPAGVEELPTS